jgi:patatin-like phospholipase/acyl hydrolase
MEVLDETNINDEDTLLLKTLSLENFKNGYSQFKSACKNADLGSQFSQMLICRLKMTASLFMANMFLEAELTALSALYLTKNKNLKSHFNEYQIKQAMLILYLLRNNDKDEIIVHFLSDKNDENTKKQFAKLSSTSSTSVNVVQVLKVNPNMINFKAEKSELERKLASDSHSLKSTIASSVIVSLVMAPPYAIVAGILAGGYAIYKYSSHLSCKKELEIVYMLENIVNMAVEAHSNNLHTKVMEILSRAYDKKSALINNFNKNNYKIDYSNIKRVLLQYGFMPDTIAYVLVMISDILLKLRYEKDFDCFYRDLTCHAIDVLKSITETSNIDLEKEALKLDKQLIESKNSDHLKELRRKLKYIEKQIIQENTIGNMNSFIPLLEKEKNLIKDEIETSFFARFNEIRISAGLNTFLIEFLEEDKNKAAIKKYLLTVQSFLNMEYKYLTYNNIRFEAFIDFIWLFNFDTDLLDVISIEKKEIKEITENPETETEIEKQLIEIKNQEIEANHESLPIAKLKIFQKIKSMYRQILNQKMSETQKTKYQKRIILGFAKCLLNLCEFKELKNLLLTKEQLLNNDPDYWCINATVDMKMNYNYENSIQSMIRAKKLDHKNLNVLKEAKKLENLTKFKNAQNYLSSLSSPNQSRKQLKSNYHSKRSIENEYRILSVDGGGVRGIIPALLLNEIELELKKPISSLFNMMAGTSTGAIIVSALSIPKMRNKIEPRYSAGDIVNLYYTESQSIFKKFSILEKFSNSWTTYTDNGRDNLFKKYFSNHKISESLTDLLVPSVSENFRLETFKFSSFNAIKTEKENYTYHQMLMATTAAPSYFLPYEIPGIGPQLDGGLKLNNPAESALMEAKKNHGSLELDKISILSLGTGSYVPEKYSFQKAKNIAYWLFNLKNYVLPADEGEVDQRMSQHLHNKYTRWQTFTENGIPFDQCDKESLDNLVEISRQYIEDLKSDESNSFNKVIEWLNQD